MSKTKKVLLAVLIPVVAIAIAVCIGVKIYSNNHSPLDSIDFTDCKIGVYGYYNSNIIGYLSDTERDDFISCLRNADVSPFGNKNYKGEGANGGVGGYLIELKNSEKIYIDSFIEYLVVDDQGYKCDDKTLAAITAFGAPLYESTYPISKHSEVNTG